MANGTWTSFDADKRKELLEAVTSCGGNISRACALVNVSRNYVYYLRKEDPEFRAELEAAVELGVEVLEDECRRRAFDGVDEPVVHKGQFCYDDKGNQLHVRKYSDTLLIFLLKGARPDKYRDRHEFSGPKGGPIPVAGVHIYLPDNGRGKPDVDAD